MNKFTDGQKLQWVHAFPAYDRRWDKLPPGAKRIFLDLVTFEDFQYGVAWVADIFEVADEMCAESTAQQFRRDS